MDRMDPEGEWVNAREIVTTTTNAMAASSASKGTVMPRSQAAMTLVQVLLLRAWKTMIIVQGDWIVLQEYMDSDVGNK